MADNLGIKDGSGAAVVLRTTEVGGIHTPHHHVPGMAEVQAAVEALSALVSGGALAVKDTALHDLVDDLETLVGNLNSYVDGLETLVGTSNTKLDALHTDLATTIAGLVTTLNGYVDGLEALVGSSNTKLDTIHTDLGTTLAGLMTDLKGYVDGLEALITSLNGYVDGLESATGATNETAPGTDTAASGLNGRLQRVAQNLTSGFGVKVTAVAALGAGGSGVIGWLSQIWDRLNSGIGIVAGEAHIGAVSGHTSYVDISLSLDTNAYVTGDVLFDTQVIADAMRTNDATGILQSVMIIDQDDVGKPFDLILLSANTSLGTENAAPDISDSAALDVLGVVNVVASDFIDLGGARIASLNSIGMIVKPAAGTRNVYVAGITRSNPTHTAGGVKLRLGFLQD